MADRKIGGKPEITLTNKQISLYISTVLKQRLDKYVETHGIEQSNVIRAALDLYLTQHNL